MSRRITCWADLTQDEQLALERERVEKFSTVLLAYEADKAAIRDALTRPVREFEAAITPLAVRLNDGLAWLVRKVRR